MDVIDTITQPWKHPVDYLKLSAWCLLFIIITFVVYDGTRIVGHYVKGAAESL